MEQKKKFLSIYPLPALIHLSLIPFTIKEITDCANEAAKSANKAEGNPPSWFFLFHDLEFQ